jgi:hypothetical protein
MSVEFSLSDDGTMDTVVECYCTVCKRMWCERFGLEHAAEYRDPETGVMSDLGFAEMLDEEDIWCEDCEE